MPVTRIDLPFYVLPVFFIAYASFTSHLITYNNSKQRRNFPWLSIMRMRWAGHVALMGEKRNVYRILVGKPEGKRPLGRPRRRWVTILKWILGR
jgi:hypothetical protein